MTLCCLVCRTLKISIGQHGKFKHIGHLLAIEMQVNQWILFHGGSIVVATSVVMVVVAMSRTDEVLTGTEYTRFV